MNDGIDVYPFGFDGPRVTFQQAISMANLGAYFIDKHDMEAPGHEDEKIAWSTCYNGCCMIFQEPHMDEVAWFIKPSGDVDKIDRYGNWIMTIEAEELDDSEF